jgi:hypothetical protein
LLTSSSGGKNVREDSSFTQSAGTVSSSVDEGKVVGEDVEGVGGRVGQSEVVLRGFEVVKSSVKGSSSVSSIVVVNVPSVAETEPPKCPSFGQSHRMSVLMYVEKMISKVTTDTKMTTSRADNRMKENMKKRKGGEEDRRGEEKRNA